MKNINRFNEFVDNSVYIKQLIDEGENTPSSDLEYISKREAYQKVISMGVKAIPYLLERNNIIWDIALSQITGIGLDSTEYDTNERKEFWVKWGKENGY